MGLFSKKPKAPPAPAVVMIPDPRIHFWSTAMIDIDTTYAQNYVAARIKDWRATKTIDVFVTWARNKDGLGIYLDGKSFGEYDQAEGAGNAVLLERCIAAGGTQLVVESSIVWDVKAGPFGLRMPHYDVEQAQSAALVTFTEYQELIEQRRLRQQAQ